MAGCWIAVCEGGRDYPSVLAARPSSGLLRLQESFAANHSMRDIADHYAEAGYIVPAPDLYCRLDADMAPHRGDADLGRALALYQRFDTEPGVLPTGPGVALSPVAIVQLRGDNLYDAHNCWNPPSVLMQIDLPDAGTVRVAAVATARTLLGASLASDTLMQRGGAAVQ